jgi:hypothetical protein
MRLIERDIPIAFKHRVYFTRNVFAIENPLLAEVLRPGQPDEHVLVEQIAVLPDLQLWPDRVGYLIASSTAPTATFGAWVQNEGSLPSAGGRLQVLEGLPGAPNSHQLLSVPLPAIPALGGVEVGGVLNWAGLLPSPPERIFAVLDPDNVVAELDESNNLTGARQRLGAGVMPRYPVYLPLILR